ncbi:MAG: periplasmic heavy metal sensor [Hyphomicrobium sp.]
MTTDVADTGQPRRRWLYGLLVASLAVNLLVAGAFAGAFWSHRHGGFRKPHDEAPGLLGFVRQLPRERREVIRDHLRAERDRIEPMRAGIRAAWDQSNAKLTVEPFDKDALRREMERLVDAERAYKTAVFDAIVTTAEKLTPDERRLLQTWRERRKPHHFKERRWRDRDRPEGGGAPDGKEMP